MDVGEGQYLSSPRTTPGRPVLSAPRNPVLPGLLSIVLCRLVRSWKALEHSGERLRTAKRTARFPCLMAHPPSSVSVKVRVLGARVHVLALVFAILLHAVSASLPHSRIGLGLHSLRLLVSLVCHPPPHFRFGSATESTANCRARVFAIMT